MIRTTLYTAKGGQGCSTVAAALALISADAGTPTYLASHDLDTAAAIFGMVTYPDDVPPLEVHSNLWISDSEPDEWPGRVIVDAGTLPRDAEMGRTDPEAGPAYLVTRPCYLALRAATRLPRPAGIVLITEPGRALTASDVAEIVGAPVVAELAQDPAVARALDAGLLASRRPRTVVRALRHMVPAPLEDDLEDEGPDDRSPYEPAGPQVAAL